LSVDQGLSAAIAAHFAGMAARHLLHETRTDEPEVVALRIECTHRQGHMETLFEFIDRNGVALGGGSL